MVHPGDRGEQLRHAEGRMRDLAVQVIGELGQQGQHLDQANEADHPHDPHEPEDLAVLPQADEAEHVGAAGGELEQQDPVEGHQQHVKHEPRSNIPSGDLGQPHFHQAAVVEAAEKRDEDVQGPKDGDTPLTDGQELEPRQREGLQRQEHHVPSHRYEVQHIPAKPPHRAGHHDEEGQAAVTGDLVAHPRPSPNVAGVLSHRPGGAHEGGQRKVLVLRPDGAQLGDPETARGADRPVGKPSG
mmetsp:Transcript_67059/g.187554  ORF Transcript_67059/g.187554 Transcript_67059/m.187554 type:complete len:242 (+) Transcript_67059:1206-1931(+)